MSDIKIISEVSVETKDAAQAVLDLKKKIKELGDEFKNSEDGSEAQREAFIKLQKAQKDLGEANKTLSSSMQDGEKKTAKFTDGVKSMAKEQLKAIGIFSLVSAGLNLLKEAFGKNQAVADLFATGMTFLSNTFQDFVNYLQKNIGNIVGWFKGIFNDPLKAVQDFGTAIKNNLIERFESLIKSAGLLGDAIGNLLKGNFDAAKASAKAAGKEFVDVVTGVNNSADKIATAAEGVADYAKKTWTAAKAQTDLANAAKLSAAQLQGLVEEYDRQAEKQRQIRDDESKSIEERIAANNELGRILKEQEKAMLAKAAVEVKSAQAALAANSTNKDLQVAVINALNNEKGIRAQITGLQSEQKVNAIALAKEQLERDKIILESANKIYFERKKAAAELIEDELLKAQTLKQINDEEAIDEFQRLSDNINNTKAGTQARVDAEIAYNEKKKEIDLAADASDANIKKIQEQRAKDLTTAKNQNSVDFLALKKSLIEAELTDEITRSNKLIAIAREEHDAKQALIISQRDAEVAAAEKAGLDTSEIKNKYNTQILANDAAQAQSIKQLSDTIIETKLNEYSTVSGLAGQLADLVGKQTIAGKALAIAQTTIDTYVAAFRAYKEGFKIDPTGIFSTISAGIAAATGISNVKKILSVQVPNTSGGGGGSVPSAPSVSAPVLPVQSSTRLDSGSIQAVGNAAQGGVVKAFVLNSDIKDANEKTELINRQARVG